MRDNVRAFVEIAEQSFRLDGPVFEFGSYLVEDQEQLADLRSVFAGREFIGCDMRRGPGVDRVEDLSNLTLSDESATTIVCVETLEHVYEVRRAMDEMIRVLAPGGVILLSTPFDFRLHDYPSDYWRLTPSCMARLLAPLSASIVGWQGPDNLPHTVFGIGCKAPVPESFLNGTGQFLDSYKAWLTGAAARVPWQTKLKRRVSGWVRSKGERRRHRYEHVAQFTVHLPVANDWKLHLFPELRDSQLSGTRGEGM